MGADGRTILVTGATGNQGGAVARRLLAAGWPVRALTRNPDKDEAGALADHGAEVVQGDLDDRDSLDRALTGVYGVFSVQDYWEHGAEAEVKQGTTLADAAKDAGVGHFIYSSVGGADRGSGLGHYESKWEVENHIRAIGLPATILRPVFLMENLLAPHYRPAILNGTLALGLQPETKLQVIACADIGAFVVLALEKPQDYIGRELEIAGEELAGPELAERIARVTGREVRFVPAPLERIRAMNPEVAEMFEWFNKDGYKADVGELRALHPEPMTFEAWLRQTGWDRMEVPAGGPPSGGPPPHAAPAGASGRE